MKSAVAAVVLLLSASVLAQDSRPSPPPIVSAENELWYRLGEPITFAGDFYYQTGPVVFFNGNTMVRTGNFLGIPLYADTTIEPYSAVLVPIGRGLLRPYERRRVGELAGTSGSTPPSFPGSLRTGLSGGYVVPNAPGAPTNLPLPLDALGVYTAEPGAVPTTGQVWPEAIDTTAPVGPARRRAGNPFRYDNVSIQFNGEKWVMAGPSIPVQTAGLEQVAEYRGFPVYAAKGRQRGRIYVPITAERLAPFERAR